MSLADVREYLQHVADRRLAVLGIEPMYGSKNPFAFMELQHVQELSNFLRTSRLRLPGRRDRHGLLRRRLLRIGDAGCHGTVASALSFRRWSAVVSPALVGEIKQPSTRSDPRWLRCGNVPSARLND
jgi:hypothetical protein